MLREVAASGNASMGELRAGMSGFVRDILFLDEATRGRDGETERAIQSVLVGPPAAGPRRSSFTGSRRSRTLTASSWSKSAA